MRPRLRLYSAKALHWRESLEPQNAEASRGTAQAFPSYATAATYCVLDIADHVAAIDSRPSVQQKVNR
jgi:hypothetical protein